MIYRIDVRSGGATANKVFKTSLGSTSTAVIFLCSLTISVNLSWVIYVAPVTSNISRFGAAAITASTEESEKATDPCKFKVSRWGNRYIFKLFDIHDIKQSNERLWHRGVESRSIKHVCEVLS